MTALRFKEIEHKFVVPASFALDTFRQVLATMSPIRHEVLRVRDRYFVTDAGRARGFILRHRHDRELHELTLKTVVGDAEVRDEINVKLRPDDQDATIDAFVEAQGVVWRGTLWKDLEVWHFDDCEVVHYVATADNREGHVIHCVEFEAVHQTTMADALAVMAKYERLTGFEHAVRTPLSLVNLMWPEVRLTP